MKRDALNEIGRLRDYEIVERAQVNLLISQSRDLKSRNHVSCITLKLCPPNFPSLEYAVMRMSQLFFQTLREVPADADVTSHLLILRAGLAHQIAA